MKNGACTARCGCACYRNRNREGRGYGEGLGAYVLCDVCHLGKEKILKDLPTIRHTAMLFENIDLVDTPVPIRPTAHYSMGGIEVAKFEDMSTKIAGIYVGGEASCISIHGANRLGKFFSRCSCN